MRLKQLILAGFALAGASVAIADPTIPSFDFETTTGFVDSGWTCNGGAVDANTCNMNFSNVNDNSTYETLAWGTEANPLDAQSNLDSPCTATRLLVNSITAGATIALHIVQGN